jgi:signal transduction histidine kinase
MRRGSGLGLSICKELVERLGGKIAASQDEEFGGANFSIWLPR